MQTRPIRGATGADITEKTLQNTVDALGLDREINELSFVEKRLVMVISLTNQLKVSQGDYARTIESASNQIRIMKEQWDRLSRAVGNVFYPILQKILPYINGVLMALTEIFNLLASLLGFEMPEFDYSGLSVTSDAALDLMDNLDGAGKSADKLASKMKGLRGFDKLNVINTPSSGGGSVSGGGGSFVDPKIMDAFNKAFENYDDMMDSVQMKARDIMKSIMHWLGFTEEIDEETGKIVWKFQGIDKLLGNMWKTFWDMPDILKLIVVGGLVKGLMKIYNYGKKIFGLISNTTAFQNFKKMVEYVKVYTSITGSKTNGLIGGIDAWKRNATAVDRLKTAIAGAGGLLVGMKLTSDGIQKINDDGFNLINTFELLGGTMASTLGGAIIGASIGGGAGAIIGAIAGGVGDLIVAFLNYDTELDKLVSKSKDSLDEVKNKSIEIQEDLADTEMKLASSMSETNYHEKLLDELNQIIDANGNIKQGYEDRAEYILKELSNAYGVEYKLVDNTIKNQDEFNNKIKEAIRLKEQEIILEAYKEDYVEALQRQNELYNDIETNEANRNDTLRALNKLLEGTGTTYQEYLDIQSKYNQGLELSAEEEKKLKAVMVERYDDQWQVFKDYEKMYQNYDEAVTQSKINYYNNNDLINKYSDYSAAVQKGDLKAIDEARDNYTKTWVKDGQVITNSDKTEQGKQIETFKATLQKWKEINDERYNTYKQSLLDISNYTGEISPQIAQKWAALGQLSEEEFLNELAKLPDNVKQQVVNKMQEQGKGISEKLQQGINERFPQITIKPQLEMPNNIYQYAQNLASKVSGWFNVTPNKAAANGGIFVNGKWQDVAQYAGGTINAPVGQMFVARERGPELVGTIGGHTAVMNNDQIVSSVASGVYQAVKSATSQQTSSQPQIFNIYLDKNNKIATYMLDKFDDMAKSNGKPIEIGG